MGPVLVAFETRCAWSGRCSRHGASGASGGVDVGQRKGGLGLLVFAVARDGAGSRRIRNEVRVVRSTQPTWREWHEV